MDNKQNKIIYYTASIDQNEKTIRRFSEINYDIFHRANKVVGLLCSFIIVVLAIVCVKTERAKILLLLLGCILVTNLDAPANYLANRVIDIFKGQFPSLCYSFTDKEIIVTGKPLNMRYSELSHIVEDNNFFFLIKSEQIGVIVNKSTVQGVKDLSGFRQFLSEKSGLKIEKPITIINLNLNVIKELFQKRNSNVGPRLK